MTITTIKQEHTTILPFPLLLYIIYHLPLLDKKERRKINVRQVVRQNPTKLFTDP